MSMVLGHIMIIRVHSSDKNGMTEPGPLVFSIHRQFYSKGNLELTSKKSQHGGMGYACYLCDGSFS